MSSGIYYKSREFKKHQSESMSGYKNPFFGKKHSQETKDRISILAKARILTVEQREKISKALKGRKMSKDHKSKIGSSLMGHIGYGKGCHLSFAHRKKIGLANSGSKSSFWRGGVSDLKRLRREKIEYKEWRNKIFERDNYTCQICLRKGGILNADHIRPIVFYPELIHEVTNGRTLCVSCHRQTETYGRKVFKILTIKSGAKGRAAISDAE